MRIAIALGCAGLLSFSTASFAEQPEGRDDNEQSEGAAGQPEEPGQPKATPDPPDMRAAHLLLSLSGGVWVPTTKLVPELPDLGEIGFGPTGHLRIGVGLSRHLVLQIEGGVAYAAGDAVSCEDCSALSIDVGGGLVYHLSQGFAVDPWVGYGLGYRHSILALSDEERSVSAFDFARLSIGADFFPVPSFGFGPYFEADIGMRGSVSYGAVHTGLRISFDPMRAGTNLSPASAAQFGFGGASF